MHEYTCVKHHVISAQMDIIPKHLSSGKFATSTVALVGWRERQNRQLYFLRPALCIIDRVGLSSYRRNPELLSALWELLKLAGLIGS